MKGLGSEYAFFISANQYRIELHVIEDVRTLLASYDYMLKKHNVVQLHNVGANFANIHLGSPSTFILLSASSVKSVY